jgi:hypothetical protein
MCRFDISFQFVKFVHYPISQWIFHKMPTQMNIQVLFFFFEFDYIIAQINIFVFLPIFNAQYIHINYCHL